MDYQTYCFVSIPEAFVTVLLFRAVLGKRATFTMWRVVAASLVAGSMLFALYSFVTSMLLLISLQVFAFYLTMLFFSTCRAFEALVGTLITFTAVLFSQAIAVSVLLPIAGKMLSGIHADFPLRFLTAYLELAMLLFSTLLLELFARLLSLPRNALTGWFSHRRNRFLVCLLVFTFLIGCTNYLLILGNYDLIATTPMGRLLVTVNFSLLAAFAVGSVYAFLRMARETGRRRAAELALLDNERKLFGSQKLEALGRVASWVAHDFNNLLTPVFGRTALLLINDRLDDDMKKHIADIQDAVRKASSLTRELLSYSRRQPGKFETINPKELLESFRGLLSVIAGEGVRFSMMVPDGLPGISGDRIRLEQVLLNLVTNARDAVSGDGSIEVIVGITDARGVPFDDGKNRSGPYLTVAVRDTGCGMDEETRRRIFEPFFSLKGPEKGTGLGLSIVQEIVSQHHGIVTVESEPGNGSTFTVFLPGCHPDKE